MVEDAGRVEQYPTTAYTDPSANAAVNAPATQTSAGVTKRCAWRWVEPDTANGVSGPAFSQANPAGNTNGGNPPQHASWGDPGVKVFNNTAPQQPGPVWCPWSVNNCGPNDEAFSFHGTGVNCLFMDGHVTFMRDNVSVLVGRYLSTPAEGIPLGIVDY
jgi:prepilin-type processing-associated H-X9-DG protein